MSASPRITRRSLLLAGVPASLLQAGCAAGRSAITPRQVELAAAPAQVFLRGSAQPPVAAWSYGGSVPGPEIRVRQGERLRVVVHNRLAQGTTVHWHGVRVPNAMDGVPHLTQPPIEPGARFVYEFDVPDAGTYWYHSHLHSAEQLERGLYGAFIVQEPQPLEVDRDLTWVLDDWRLTREGRLNESFNDPHDVAHAGRLGNVVTVNGSFPRDLALRRGERVRLRLINAANARIFSLQFDGHRPRVVAIDGQPVMPHEPAGGRVTLAPAMRCDLVLDAIGEPGKSYAVGDVFNPRAAYDLLQLAYGPTVLREQFLEAPVALAPNALPEPDIDSALRHEIRFEGGMMGRMHQALLNGKPLNMMGLLRQGKAWAVNGVVADGHDMKPMLSLQRGRSYVLALHNDTRWHHPMHLHGHSFRVIRRNGQPTRYREWQDTVLMDPQERVDIVFVADNPGDWMFHCHILEHQDGGMMSVVRVSA
jgi:FtsP/CotA-like multicopper oxidase with cupredoxin domain